MTSDSEKLKGKTKFWAPGKGEGGQMTFLESSKDIRDAFKRQRFGGGIPGQLCPLCKLGVPVSTMSVVVEDFKLTMVSLVDLDTYPDAHPFKMIEKVDNE